MAIDIYIDLLGKLSFPTYPRVGSGTDKIACRLVCDDIDYANTLIKEEQQKQEPTTHYDRLEHKYHGTFDEIAFFNFVVGCRSHRRLPPRRGYRPRLS